MINFLLTYWWAVALVLLVGVFFALKKLANKQAKAFALKYLIAFEQTVFKTSDVEVGVAAHLVYQSLPTRLKFFVPEMVFEAIVGEIYSEVKKLIAELESENVQN